MIVNRGKGNAVLREAEGCGVTAATIFLGESMGQNTVLERLGLIGLHREVLMIQAREALCPKLYKALEGPNAPFKPGKGIVFSVPFKRWQPAGTPPSAEADHDDAHATHQCIVTIVDRGRGDACIAAARAVGARDGILVRGRGAGVPKDFYVPLVIEPQKDIVMIVAAKESTAVIRKKIFEDLELDRAGHGILFTLPVMEPRGLFANEVSEREEGAQ